MKINKKIRYARVTTRDGVSLVSFGWGIHCVDKKIVTVTRIFSHKSVAILKVKIENVSKMLVSEAEHLLTQDEAIDLVNFGELSLEEGEVIPEFVPMISKSVGSFCELIFLRLEDNYAAVAHSDGGYIKTIHADEGHNILDCLRERYEILEGDLSKKNGQHF